MIFSLQIADCYCRGVNLPIPIRKFHLIVLAPVCGESPAAGPFCPSQWDNAVNIRQYKPLQTGPINLSISSPTLHLKMNYLFDINREEILDNGCWGTQSVCISSWIDQTFQNNMTMLTRYTCDYEGKMVQVATDR